MSIEFRICSKEFAEERDKIDKILQMYEKGAITRLELLSRITEKIQIPTKGDSDEV